ncbi:hypothetical protein [Mycobacterium uberis]|uniref:hypothetical protein n=1 Tax=Mycobacterium uberis TaxID=2162698 RepID=UPI000E30B052|nr:hypothetical protein [Mycobacterium uberis]
MAQAVRILRTTTGWVSSDFTLLHHFHRLKLTDPNANEHRPVFETADPNELGGSNRLHGPRSNDRKTYRLVFLNDHSRLAARSAPAHDHLTANPTM